MAFCPGDFRRGEGLLTLVLWMSGTVIAAGLLMAVFYTPQEKEASKEEIEESNRIVMQNVTIEVFDKQLTRNAWLAGKQAITFKTNQDTIVTPVDALLYRRGGRTLKIDAEKLWKRIEREDERMEFIGNVRVVSQEQKLATTGSLIYHMNTHSLESSSHVTILTTGTLVMADRLKSHTDIQTGSLDGRVQISTTRSLGAADGRGKPAAGRSVPGSGRTTGSRGVTESGASSGATTPLLLTGNSATFDLVREQYELTGAAKGIHEDMIIESEALSHHRQEDLVRARGSVKVLHANLSLTCGYLEYVVSKRLVTAREKPVAVQILTPESADESKSRNTLRGDVLVADVGRKDLRGKGSVKFQREVVFEGSWDRDFAVDADEFTHDYDKQRTNFTGAVKIESSSLGATGDRAIFYKQQERIYIIGNAHAWDVDMEGKQSNHISGKMIIHHLRTGKNVVLGQVEGSFGEGGEK